MSLNKTIYGEVRLLNEVNGMPEVGFTTPRHRVELFEEVNPAAAWITEIIVLGDLPWREGEGRRVEIRIMSDEFRDYVTINRPHLLVRYGSRVIGSLELE